MGIVIGYRVGAMSRVGCAYLGLREVSLGGKLVCIVEIAISVGRSLWLWDRGRGRCRVEVGAGLLGRARAVW